jgi:pilus assembly protein CpaF
VTPRDAYEVVRREVVDAIEMRRLQPDRDVAEIREEARRSVTEFQRRARLGDEMSLVDPQAMVERIVDSVTELGALTELMQRRDVEEIFIEGARVSYIDGGGELRGMTTPTTEEQNRQVVERLLGATERHLSAQYPIVQARVLDGSARLTVAIPPVADRLSATMRRYVVRHVSLADLVHRYRRPRLDCSGLPCKCGVECW